MGREAHGDRRRDFLKEGLSEEGTFEHRAGKGGTHAKRLEEFSTEEGQAEQRTWARTNLGCFKNAKEAGAGVVGAEMEKQHMLPGVQPRRDTDVNATR